METPSQVQPISSLIPVPQDMEEGFLFVLLLTKTTLESLEKKKNKVNVPGSLEINVNRIALFWCTNLLPSECSTCKP